MMLKPVHRWSCPNCKVTSITHEAVPHTRFHTCPGLRGLTAPMVREGDRVQVRAVEREDYIGDSNAGRVMAVVTDRPDGSNDTAVFAPTATIAARST
jgi:hypothetical protein